ncbi:hypothetical protein ABEX88_08120 [Priestia megaterium]
MAISIEERKALRKELLLELYNYYFENGGAHYKITKDVLKEDRERDLALEYLKLKGLISANPLGNSHVMIKITPNGIDKIEN